MVGVEVLANVGVNTRGFAARGFDLRVFAGEAVHIRGGAAEVGNHPSETGHFVADFFDFADDGFLRTVLDNASFVFGDRAESAATKAAAHDVHREADHFIGGDAFAFIGRVRQASVGQPEHVIHFRRGQRDRRWVDPHVHLPVFLHQGGARSLTKVVGYSPLETGFADFSTHVRRRARALLRPMRICCAVYLTASNF